MATSGQGLSFGDFEDLSPEENLRIFHILHGQKNFPSRVEFPWDGESEGLIGEDEGNNYFLEKPGIPDVPGAQTSDYPVSQEIEFSFGTVQVSQYTSYGSEPRHYLSFDNSNDAQQIGKSSEDEAAMQEDRNTQSKLQASLKPYERRNKKKRPPDYYKEKVDDSQHHGAVREGYRRPGEQAQQEIVGHHSGYPVYRNVGSPGITYGDVGNLLSGNPPYMGGVYMPDFNTFSAPPPNFDVATNSFTNQQQHSELEEIVVDRNNPAYSMPASTEAFQMADHIQTGNKQYGGHSGYVNDSVAPVNSEINNRVNQINTPPVSGHTSKVDNSAPLHSVSVPISSSHHQHHQQQQQLSINNTGLQFGTGTDIININQVIPDSNIIPGEMSRIEPQQTVIGHTTAGLMLSGQSGTNKPVVEVVNSSVDSQVKPEPMDTMVTDVKSVNSVNSIKVAQESVTDTETTSTSSANSCVNSVQTEARPKTTWAGLFKGNSASTNPPQVIYSGDKSELLGNKPDNNQVAKKPEKEYSPVPVPAEDDSIAKELGELLSQMSISHASIALQPRGLVNRGNWCYINGTLQALVACPPFYNLLKKMPKYPALSRGPSSTPILDSLVEFVHEFQAMPRIPIEKGQRNKGLREISPGPPFEPSYVYKMLQAIAVNPHFKLGKQEDAEEFLSCILDGTHEEMAAAVNLTNKLLSETSLTDPGAGEEENYTNGYYHDEEEEMQDDENWEQVGPKKKSVLTRRSSFAKTPIADIFAGMIRSAVYKASAKETATLEPFFTLQLDIQSEKVCSVRDALEGLVSKEVISGYTDTKTNSEVEVVKKLSLEELPPVLILHLKFFVYNKDGGSQKLMKKVDYPVELEITKDLLSPNARSKLNAHQRTYKLFAAVYHHGKHMTGGHYTTCVFHPGINGWVLSDDSTVRTVPVSMVLKYSPPRIPYLLYYRRLDSH